MLPFSNSGKDSSVCSIRCLQHSGGAFMVGHKLGEFAPTRTFRGHSGNHNEAAAAASPSAKSASGATPAAKPAAK